MHASIRRYIVNTSHEWDAVKHAQDGFMPILQSVPGFVAYYFVRSTDGEMIGVSVFETKEGAEQANELAATYVSEFLSEMLTRTMLIEGDVVAHAHANKK